MATMDRKRISDLARSALWVPQPGPQLQAMQCKADVLLFGGSAGGGKTALGIGLALTSHQRTLFIRKEAIQLQPVVDEIATILGSRDGFNGQSNVWRTPDARTIQFGGVPNPGDESKFQGNPRDLLVCDEAANLFEAQVRFLMGWVRSTRPGQRCRTLLCTNPPTSSDGEWVIRWFAPWLDKQFPNPAQPGELRWVTTLPGLDGQPQDMWVDSPQPFLHKGELITPLSRSFIPSRVTDNRYLRGTGYVAQLQALPEPLRSMMLKGDFTAGRDDNPYQVIPSDWVRDAQERWRARKRPDVPMTSLGVDVARGGADHTVLAPRYWNWIGELIVERGKSTPDGPVVATLAMKHRRDNATLHVDVIGVGSSVYDTLRPTLGNKVIALNGSHSSKAKDRSKQLGFANKRSEWWWRLREKLDPLTGDNLALPPDQTLLADLCSPQWKMAARGIQVESKDEIAKRIGRSTDRGDSVVYAFAIGYGAPTFDGLGSMEDPILPRRI